MSALRREHLIELGVVQLVNLVLALESENEALRRALGGNMCGHLSDGRSCQLPQGHAGVHVWMQPDAGAIVRW